jgi:hypothetical protein
MLEIRLRSMPKPIRRVIRNSVFSSKPKKTYAKQASQSLKSIYPEGDVFHYLEKQNAYDYTIEIHECAKMKFAKKVDALEFMPYICLIGKLWAEVFEYGLERKGRLADGFEKCDFNLKRQGKVEVFSTVMNSTES